MLSVACNRITEETVFFLIGLKVIENKVKLQIELELDDQLHHWKINQLEIVILISFVASLLIQFQF